MKKYNIPGYIIDKEDLKQAIARIPEYGTDYHLYTRDELIVTFLPLVENLARKFSTSQQASGVMTINDLIQEGSNGLIAAVDKIIWENIIESEEGGSERYDPNRGQEVIKYVREFFDKYIPIEGTSWKNIAGLKIIDKDLIICKDDYEIDSFFFEIQPADFSANLVVFKTAVNDSLYEFNFNYPFPTKDSMRYEAYVKAVDLVGNSNNKVYFFTAK